MILEMLCHFLNDHTNENVQYNNNNNRCSDINNDNGFYENIEPDDCIE